MLGFDPYVLFSALYRSSLTHASTAYLERFDLANRDKLQNYFLELCAGHFQHLFLVAQQPSFTSAAIHSSIIKEFENQWALVFSTSTCLVCLRRRPQYALPCTHVICENCVIVFGEDCVDDPWAYKVPECFLCREQIPGPFIVRVRPPTAGVGVLCIDGGGTRGIIPLQVLKRLEDCIGLPIPVQKLFQVAFGISSGTFSK
jgi:hypothetical protein